MRGFLASQLTIKGQYESYIGVPITHFMDFLLKLMTFWEKLNRAGDNTP
jgi:hypothetical protein